MALSVVLTPTTHQSNPSHSAAHNELHHAHNTFWGGDYTLAKLTLDGPNSQRTVAPGSGLGFLEPRRAHIYDGMIGHEVTVDVPSVLISRVSAFNAPPAMDNALAVFSLANSPADAATNTALRGYAVQINAGDLVGTEGTAVIDKGASGTGQVAYALYTTAVDFKGSGYTVGSNPTNQVLASVPYVAPGTLGSYSSFAQAALATAPGDVPATGHQYLVSAAYAIYANTPADVAYDVGFVAALGVKNQAFRDDTSAVSSFYDAGSHTDGVVLAGTYSGSPISLPAGVAYAPTVTASTGTYTSVSAAGHYRRYGKMIFINVVINQSNATGANDDIHFPLPLSLTARDGGALAAYDATTGKTCRASIVVGEGTVRVSLYDGSTAVATGHFLEVSGWVEVS